VAIKRMRYCRCQYYRERVAAGGSKHRAAEKAVISLLLKVNGKALSSDLNDLHH
jgi:hypothetical protein